MTLRSLLRATMVTIALSAALRTGTLFAEDIVPTHDSPAKPAPQNPSDERIRSTLPAAPAPAPSTGGADPALPATQTTDALLFQLRARSNTLDRREAALNLREQILHATEAKLATRLSQLNALQSRLDAEQATRNTGDWAGLVKAYESMKPRDAAAIFNALELPVLLPVLDRMKDIKAGAILAAMDADRARTVTAALAAFRLHPTDHAAPAP